MCTRPLLAHYGKINEETGKRSLVFLPQRVDLTYEKAKDFYGADLLELPCGNCPQCNRLYSRSWIVRCLAELMYHDKSCFVTLTYRTANLPFDNDNWKEDLTKFLKRLRKHKGSFRYFACGEFGEKNNRPHFHLIFFGLDFEDKKKLFSNALGQDIFVSKELEDIWENGLCSVGEVTAQSISYVARYALKKRLTGEDKGEFLRMSRKPGLGFQFFEDNKNTLFLADKVYFNGQPKAFVLPRFYFKLAESDVDGLINYFGERLRLSKSSKAASRKYENMIKLGLSDIAQAYKETEKDELQRLSILKRSI